MLMDRFGMAGKRNILMFMNFHDGAALRVYRANEGERDGMDRAKKYARNSLRAPQNGRSLSLYR